MPPDFSLCAQWGGKNGNFYLRKKKKPQWFEYLSSKKTIGGDFENLIYTCTLAQSGKPQTQMCS